MGIFKRMIFWMRAKNWKTGVVFSRLGFVVCNVEDITDTHQYERN
jgi:hypothetical protein